MFKFGTMANKDLELDKGKEKTSNRHLEKDHYLGEGRLFEDEEAKEDEELVNANDPEKRFIPIDQIPDLVDENEERTPEEQLYEEREEPSQEDDKRLANNIADYAHKSRGAKYSQLESFHLDHDKKETLAVYPGVELEEEEQDREDWQQEVVAQLQKEIKEKEKMYDEINNGIDTKRSSRDNRKTWNDSKVQRNSRGLLRKIFKN